MRSNTPTPHTDSPEAEITHHGAPLAVGGTVKGGAWGIVGEGARDGAECMPAAVWIGIDMGSAAGDVNVTYLVHSDGRLEVVEPTPEKTPERGDDSSQGLAE